MTAIAAATPSIASAWRTESIAPDQSRHPSTHGARNRYPSGLIPATDPAFPDPHPCTGRRINPTATRVGKRGRDDAGTSADHRRSPGGRCAVNPSAHRRHAAPFGSTLRRPPIRRVQQQLSSTTPHDQAAGHLNTPGSRFPEPWLRNLAV